jgi:DNA polymerase III sliding clamp (beta) subunit (PCNA family)
VRKFTSKDYPKNFIRFDVTTSDKVFISATDDDNNIRTQSANYSVKSIGIVTFSIDATQLHKALKETNSDSVLLKVTEDGHGHLIQLISNDFAGSFAGAPLEHLPLFKQITEDHKKAYLPLHQITQIGKDFVVKDSFFEIDRRVYIEFNSDSIIATASNRRILYTNKLPITTFEDLTGTSIGIPMKTISKLNNILPKQEQPIEVKFDKSIMSFELNGFTLTSNLVNDKYLDYKSGLEILKPNTTTTLDTADVLSAIKQVKGFANETTNEIIFNLFPDRIEIHAEKALYENNEEEKISSPIITINTTIPISEQHKIGLNWDYLKTILTTIDNGSFQFSFNTEKYSNPMWIQQETNPNLVILMMPIII